VPIDDISIVDCGGSPDEWRRRTLTLTPGLRQDDPVELRVAATQASIVRQIMNCLLSKIPHEAFPLLIDPLPLGLLRGHVVIVTEEWVRFKRRPSPRNDQLRSPRPFTTFHDRDAPCERG
jgi:hypothetical protein